MRLIVSALILLTLASAGCRRSAHSLPQAIAGAMLIDGTPAPPTPDSVVLVSRGRVLAAGPASSTPVPDGYNLIDAKGRFLFPASLTSPIRVGEEANLLLLSVNPALDPDYLKKVVGQMENGRWVQYPQ